MRHNSGGGNGVTVIRSDLLPAFDPQCHRRPVFSPSERSFVSPQFAPSVDLKAGVARSQEADVVVTNASFWSRTVYAAIPDGLERSLVFSFLIVDVHAQH